MPIETSMYGMQPAVKLDPAGAISAAQGIQSLQASQYELITKQMTQMRSSLGTLAADPNLTPEKVLATTQNLVRQGLITPQQAATELQGLPSNPGELKQWATGKLMNVMDSHARFEQAYGRPESLNDGQQTILYNRSQTNGVTQQAAAPNQISPESQGALVAGPVGPNGEATQELAGRARAAGGFVPPPSGFQGPAVRNRLMTPAAPVAPATPNRLGVQPPAATPVAPTPIPPPVAPAGAGVAMPGPRVMGLPAGANEASTRTAAASADQGSELQKAADAAQQSKSILADMEKHAEGLALGPASPALRKGGALANQVAGAAGYKEPFGFVKSQEQFTKLAEQLRQQQAKALSGTDASLSSAGASTPNETYSAEGVRGMITSLKGNQDAIAVKNQEWQKWKREQPNGASRYGDFQEQFNKQFEPRVFQLPYMKKEEAQKMIKNLTPAEREKVAEAYSRAKENGWIKPPKAD